MIPGSKGHAGLSCLHVRDGMCLYDPPKHEKEAIFPGKMCEFRMFCRFFGSSKSEKNRIIISCHDMRILFRIARMRSMEQSVIS